MGRIMADAGFRRLAEGAHPDSISSWVKVDRRVAVSCTTQLQYTVSSRRKRHLRDFLLDRDQGRVREDKLHSVLLSQINQFCSAFTIRILQLSILSWLKTSDITTH